MQRRAAAWTRCRAWRRRASIRRCCSCCFSAVDGGFVALHQHQAHSLDAVLVGHDPCTCVVCGGGGDGGDGRGRATPGVDAPTPVAPQPAAASPARQWAAEAAALQQRAPAAVRKRVDALAKWLKSPTAKGGAPASAAAVTTAAATPDDGDEVEIGLFTMDEPAAPQPAPAPVPAPGSVLRTRAEKVATALKSTAAAVLSPPPAPAHQRRSRASSTAARAPPAEPPTGPPAPPGGRRDWAIDGYDAAGLPILSEDALLEAQCDDIERSAGLVSSGRRTGMSRPSAFGGRSRRSTSGSVSEAGAASATAATPAPSGRPPPHIAIHATSTAAKGWLKGLLVTPPASNAAVTAAPGAGGVHDIGTAIPAATQRTLAARGKEGAITPRTTAFLSAHAAAHGSDPPPPPASAPAPPAAVGRRFASLFGGGGGKGGAAPAPGASV
jgi:hypothetical protein